MSDSQGTNIQAQLRVKSYPCLERGDVVWTYMGPPEHKPEFPDLEWTLVPQSHRYATRDVQECNWLQALEGGFDATHLTFLHGGDAEPSRRIVAVLYEVIPTDFGFVVGTGRNPGNGNIMWNVNVNADAVPQDHFFHAAGSACVGADRRRKHHALQRRFLPSRPLTEEDTARSKAGFGIHTENIPGTDHAIRNKANDYLIDRALQASGKSYTGTKGFGTQDCLSRNRWDRSPTAPPNICSRVIRRSSKSAVCCCKRSGTMPPADDSRAWPPRATGYAPAVSRRRRESRSRRRWKDTSGAIHRLRPNRRRSRHAKGARSIARRAA
jgi:hypothetical protein